MEVLSDSFVSLGAYVVELAPMICFGLFFVFLEFKAPRREGNPDGLRWLTGAALMFTGWAVVMLLAPVSSMVAAQIASENGVGLLNAFAVPYAAAFVIGFLLFDLSRYAMHRILHEVPILWRLHRVHHSDEQVDASTALRNHPAEALAGTFFSVVIVTLLGIPPAVILTHFMCMQVVDLWQHANIRSFPGQRKLGLLINIPEFHAVHHSIAHEHHNSNYGSLLSVWDRAFGTLVDDPEIEGKLNYGLDKDYWDHPSTVGSLLIDPIRK